MSLRDRRDTRGGEGHVAMEAEIAVMCLPAKEHLEAMDAGKSKEGPSPPGFRDSETLLTLISNFWLPEI